MSFKKYDGSTWQSINPKQLKGIPYTGTLPAVLTGTKAGYLHRYKIYGNTEQTGTPTPENPIVPSECGERTDNLFDVNSDKVAGYIDDRGNIAQGGNEIWTYDYIDIYGAIDYTYLGYTVTDAAYTTIRVAWFDASKSFISRTYVLRDGMNPRTVTTPNNARYARLSIDNGIKDIVFTEGLTPPESYVPFGYKLPLTSAGQDVDIYLGEATSTRQIRTLVLTGEESWTKSSQAFYSDVIDSYAKRSSECVCSHFPYSTANGICITLPSKMLKVFETALPSGVTTSEQLKAYLAQQYANGTPVIVWYVLATEETGTLNEPLRKIGDYADTTDSTQTNVQIPTTANSTTISWAGEGLAPSQFDSIQEWVDIPTYTRVNGEWVADN